MKKLTKKHFILLGSIILVLCFVMIYFRPIPLSTLIEGQDIVRFQYVELGVRDGVAYADGTDLILLTEEERDGLLELLEGYTYSKSIETLFSTGSMDGLGNEVVYIYTYLDELSNDITISSLDRVSINGTVYHLSNSAELIDEITAMVIE